MTSLLAVEELEVGFGGVRALNGVTMHVEGGEVVGLIGPNGAGKTTMLNIVTGVYRASGGSIHYRGHDLRYESPHRIAANGIARTFQNIRLFEGLSVLDHLMLALGTNDSAFSLFTSLRRKSIEQVAGTTVLGDVRETLERVDLWARRHERAVDLPYGLQRKLEICRALALRPRLLLLDEPTAGMGNEDAGQVARLIDRLRDTGLGIVLIEHNVPFVAETCDRVVVLNFGEKIAEGTPTEIQQDERVLEAYLG